MEQFFCDNIGGKRNSCGVGYFTDFIYEYVVFRK